MSDEELIKKYVSKDNYEKAIQKLKSGYPVQYIIGNVEFYDSLIKVNENVLIPRFETEYLVEKTIKYLKKLKIDNPQVLEIGTGSGCISIAIKKNIDSIVDAIDISEKAIEVAKLNALNNNVEINFEIEDINKFISQKKYDLIISNPPYVPYNLVVDKKTKYEPQNAIFAENNGLYFYNIILEKIINNLSENYLISFEIGDKQGNFIKEIIKKYLPKAYILIEKDYNNHDRYAFISNKEI